MKFDWPSLGQVAVNTVVVYFFLVAAISVFGRRQLGQLTVVDLLVTILLGSAVETAMIHGDTSLKAGLLSAGLLLVVNRTVSAAFLRSPKFRHLVGCGPVLLVRDGRLLFDHMRKIGFTEDDVLAALRQRGYAGPDGIAYAVFEADGTVNVVAAKDSAQGKETEPS